MELRLFKIAAYGTSLPNILYPPPLQSDYVTACGADALQRTSSYTQVIRSNRLRWLSHIWRSPENNQTRAYTFNLRILWDLEQEEDHQQGGYR
ncbi:hypothetical protein TNCV_3150491 [Trichonephila clavipes]|nr:hypothetical protein TNCV_3150491 [Trichonephila clavipes]